jgi:sugar lactone lactonase YvrE
MPLLLGGCGATSKHEQALLFWPAPPAEPRIQFLTWASGADQVEPARGSFEDFILGEEPVVERAINKPYGIAAHDGAVYVCDTKGLSLCRLDFRNRTFSVVGARGPGRLRKPINLVIDPLGYKFVADTVRRQIVIFGPDDQYTTAFEIPEPCHPVDVAIYENELYVLDNDDTCQILVLDRTTGKVLRTFGEPGGEPGQFKIPNSLCFGPQGYLYVSDTHNWRIQKLTREGEPVWVKGAPGRVLGQFGRPRGVRVGPDGIIYVVDGATEIVQMYDSDGQILMRFGGPGNVPGALALPATLAVDTTSLPYFQQYVHEDFKVEYLLFVSSQYGAHLVSVYAFGSFPEGYKLSESEIAALPPPADKGIGPAEPATPATGPAQPEQE